MSAQPDNLTAVQVGSDLGLELVPELDPIPEQFRPKEYGHHALEDIPLGELCTPTQIRPDGSNGEAAEIAESIERRGLINLPDVAVLESDLFEDYIAFLNEVWGSDHEISEFPMREDGRYALVVAGYTRVGSIRANEVARSARAAADGYTTNPDEAVVQCKIHDIHTSAEIVALQIEENLHSQPPAERKAMVLVETFLYGLRHGEWENKAQFLRVHGDRFSRHELNNALHFAELPTELRTFVLEGAIPYLAGVSLGETLQPLQDHILGEYFGGRPYDQLTPGEQMELDQQVIEWAGTEIARIQTSSLSGTRAAKRFAEYRRNWREVQEVRDREAHGEVAEVRMFELDDDSERWRRQRTQTRREYRGAITSLAQGPLERAGRAVALHQRLFGAESPELVDLQLGIEKRLHEFVDGVGQTASSMALEAAET